MHLLIADRLVCPRCGPPFGLVLLADRVVERRVLAGSLGCPNCRDRFPVVDGFADLRAPPRTPLRAPTRSDTPSDTPPDAEQTLRLAAFLGVTEGPAQVALVGPVVAHAAGVAERIAELEVAAVSASLLGTPERPGVSRMVAAPRLPFQDRALRGVVLSGEASDRLLEEAARTVAPGARVVLLDAPEDARARLEMEGLRVLLTDGGMAGGEVTKGGLAVAERTGPRVPSSGTRLPVVQPPK